MYSLAWPLVNMENKQTAIEWLTEVSFFNEFISDYNFDKAKLMEKEQMIEFANSFYDDCVMEGGSLKRSAEEHYDKTYNQQDNG